jgi:hypothetical protein
MMISDKFKNVRRLVHFYFCMGTASEQVGERQHRRSEIAVYRHLVHFIQGQINHARDEAANADRAHQVTHQIADRGVSAQ